MPDYFPAVPKTGPASGKTATNITLYEAGRQAFSSNMRILQADPTLGKSCTCLRSADLQADLPFQELDCPQGFQLRTKRGRGPAHNERQASGK